MALAVAGCDDEAEPRSQLAAPALMATATPDPETTRLTISVSGDLLPHLPVVARARTPHGYDFAPLLSELRPLVSRADLAFCHVETPLQSGTPTGYPRFRTPPALARAIRRTGWDACSTASNHTLDQGVAGVRSTIRALNGAKVAHTGSAMTRRGGRRILLLRRRGVTVAFLSYTQHTNGLSVPHPWSVNLATPRRILHDARRARRKGADAVIVNLHWGTEYRHSPDAYQLRLARRLTRGQAITAIVGQHAHVVQPDPPDGPPLDRVRHRQPALEPVRRLLRRRHAGRHGRDPPAARARRPGAGGEGPLRAHLRPPSRHPGPPRPARRCVVGADDRGRGPPQGPAAGAALSTLQDAMARVKFCGITRLEDAEHAAELDAWAIGFILWPGSKRAADPAVAAGIARAVRRRLEPVGVFVNPTLDEVARAVEGIGLTLVQLHGDEGPAFCAAVAQRTGARVIKALRVGSGADIRDAERFHTDFHLLDTAAGAARGGTGRTWDWRLAAQRRSPVPVLLSGGLTPENVAEGIAAVHPWGVDVSSGVETAPGIKDPARMEAFAAAAGAAASEAATSAKREAVP